MSFFNDFKKNVSGFTENVAQKSTDAIEISKMKMQKTSLEGESKDCYVELGKLYEQNLGQNYDPDSEEGRLVIKLQEIRESITCIDEKLRSLKGVVRCDCCGENVSSEFEFCPKCGAKLNKESTQFEEKVVYEGYSEEAAEEAPAESAAEEGSKEEACGCEDAQAAAEDQEA